MGDDRRPGSDVSTTPERWHAVKAVLSEALTRPVQERAAF
jgi:hypothetical protein